MAYYLKISLLSFVWKWKIVITYFCQFMEELQWQFQQLLQSIIVKPQSVQVDKDEALYIFKSSQSLTNPISGKEYA